jgi:hypothetical protein
MYAAADRLTINVTFTRAPTADSSHAYRLTWAKSPTSRRSTSRVTWLVIG